MTIEKIFDKKLKNQSKLDKTKNFDICGFAYPLRTIVKISFMLRRLCTMLCLSQF